MAGYGYKPRNYGYQPMGSTRTTVTPLGISTRVAAKPAVKKDPVAGALAARSQGMNQQYGLGAYANQKAPAAPRPAAAPAAPAAGAPTAPALSYDYKTDPILNQITALSSQQRGDAQANALMLKKQLAIDYGDPALGNSLGDAGTAAAAASNPFSVRKQLDTSYQKGVGQLDEQFNNQNLWYGGARAKGLGDFAQQYQGQLAGAAGQQQSALGQIDSNLAAALLGADQQDILGQQNAQGSALSSALTAGIDPGVAQANPIQGSPWDQGIASAINAPYDPTDIIARLLKLKR